jgi:DNA repair protein RadC
MFVCLMMMSNNDVLLLMILVIGCVDAFDNHPSAIVQSAMKC